MTVPDDKDRSDEIQIGDLFAPLLRYRRLIGFGTMAAALLTLAAGGSYFLWQPVSWSMSLEFKPVFMGADEGRYPNQLLFASSDVVNATILDQVYDKNHAQEFCAREDFRAGFSVLEYSTRLQ